MNRYDITFSGLLVRTDDPSNPPEPSDVEAYVDLIVSELETLSAEDIDISTNVRECTIKIRLTVTEPDLPSAQITGSGQIRTALHAAGVNTPEWSIDWIEATAAPQTDEDERDGELLDA